MIATVGRMTDLPSGWFADAVECAIRPPVVEPAPVPAPVPVPRRVVVLKPKDCPLAAAIRAGLDADELMWRIFGDMARLGRAS